MSGDFFVFFLTRYIATDRIHCVSQGKYMMRGKTNDKNKISLCTEDWSLKIPWKIKKNIYIRYTEDRWQQYILKPYFFNVTDIIQHICFKLGVLIQHIWPNLKDIYCIFLIERLNFFLNEKNKKIIIYINKKL